MKKILRNLKKVKIIFELIKNNFFYYNINNINCKSN